MGVDRLNHWGRTGALKSRSTVQVWYGTKKLEKNVFCEGVRTMTRTSSPRRVMEKVGDVPSTLQIRRNSRVAKESLSPVYYAAATPVPSCISTPGDIHNVVQKMKMTLPIRKAVAATAFVISVVILVTTIATVSVPTCFDCRAVHIVGDYPLSNPTSVNYGNMTFLLADDAAADTFIANPEELLPLTLKASMLWTNPGYWLGEGAKAERCACA